MIPASFDFVRIEGFTEPTAKWLGEIIESLWGTPPPHLTVEQASALYFIIRAQPDDVFPGGKWATVQHLEGLIEQTVREAT